MILKRIQVASDCALEQKGSLWNNRDVLPQSVQSHLQGIAATDLILSASFRLIQPKECLDYRGLACACSAHNAHFFFVVDVEAHIREHFRQMGLISQVKISDFDCRVLWPAHAFSIALCYFIMDFSLLLVAVITYHFFVIIICT